MKKDWDIKKLEDVCEFLDSRRKPITANKRTKGPIPYYGATGILDYVADFLFDEELILLGEDGAKWGPGDKSAFRISGKTWVNNHAHVLKPKNMNYDWIIYYLNYSDLMKFVKGATVPKLNQENAKNISIPVPPLEEQKRIVKILDEKFAQLETIKANAQTNLQNAKDLFQSQLTKAFSNTSWEKKRLYELCSRIFAGGDKPQIVSKEISETCQIPIYANGITDDGLYGYTNEATVFDKCLTISARGTIGFTCIRNKPFVPIVRLLVLIPKDEINISYLKYGCDTLTITNTGSSIPQLTVPMIKDYKIPLPPLSEQKRIVKELDALSETVLQLQEIYTKQIANCDELKQAYLQKAFEGEL